MGIRPRILIGLLIAALGIVAWRVSVPAEPVYDGKKISDWIARSGEYYEGSYIARISPLPRSADSNAIPYLVKALNMQKNPSSRLYVWLYFRLPRHSQHRFRPPVFAEQIRENVAMWLGCMGAVAKPAIPALIRAMKEDESEDVRGASAWSLGHLANQDQRVIKELADALNDKSDVVRLQSVMALDSCGPVGKSVVFWALTNRVEEMKKGAVNEAAPSALRAIRSEPQAPADATRNQ